MRRTELLLVTLAGLSLLTGCTTTQVKEGTGQVAGGLLMVALDIALDGPERRAEERREWEDNPANRWSACLSPCELRQEWAKDAQRKETERRERRADAEEFRADFDEFMHALEEAEQQSGDPPLVMMTNE
jgi:hypothetical protein